MISESMLRKLDAVCERNAEKAARSLTRLVRVPSVSVPPEGNEGPLQELVADQLWDLGMEVSRVFPAVTSEFCHHPAYQKNRDLRRRPNVWGVRAGAGGGRSLLLVGHPDTLPPLQNVAWPGGDPYSGAKKDGCVYGPGAATGKAGMAAALTALYLLREADIRLKGDVTFASVVDEEWMGCQGMLSLILEGVRADGALYLAGAEPGCAVAGNGLCDSSIRFTGLRAGRGETTLQNVVNGIDVLRGALPVSDSVMPPLALQSLIYNAGAHGASMDVQVQLPVTSGEDLEKRVEHAGALLAKGVVEAGGDVSFTLGPRVLESWICRDDALADLLRAVPLPAWAVAPERVASPSGAFLLANHAGIPTAVVGMRPKLNPEKPEYVELARLQEYVRLLCMTLIAWCGVEE